MDAGAVAGLAVGIDRAAMPDRLQRIDAGYNHLAPPLAVEATTRPTPQESDPVGGVVAVGFGQPLGAGDVWRTNSSADMADFLVAR